MKSDKRDTALHPQIRDTLTAFKLTKSEREALDARVKEEGVSLSRYLRHVVMNDVNSGE